MIQWATIDAALKLAVQTMTGLTDVSWRWEPSAVRKVQYIILERSPVIALGNDCREHRRVPVTDNPDRIETRQHGQRQFDLELRCVSTAGRPSDSAPLDAADLLAVVLTRISRPSISDAFAAAGVAFSNAGPIVRQTYSVDGREMRAAILTLTMLTYDVDADADDEAIESVNGTIAVDSPDGTTVTRTFSVP